MTVDNIITLKNVTKQFDQTLAVDNLSIAVEAGKILVLLGQSGCGKTTTLRLIAGLERPNDGEIWVNNIKVAGHHTWIPPERRHIGMVFQDYALFPHLTIRENIAFALNKVKRDRREKRIDEMLSLISLSEKGNDYPHQLSGGQQQRVSLARALASSPGIVLLDEPFSNLDASLRKVMRDEVRDILRHAGETAIFVTHDQEEAMSLADEIAVMQNGSIAQLDTPNALYRYPKTPQIADFLGETNYLDGEANRHRVSTAIGDLPLVNPMHGRVCVMIRPEAIQLTTDSRSDFVVAEKVYYGHDFIVTLTNANGIKLKTRVWAHTNLSIGEHVRIQVSGDIIAFDNQQ